MFGVTAPNANLIADNIFEAWGTKLGLLIIIDVLTPGGTKLGSHFGSSIHRRSRAAPECSLGNGLPDHTIVMTAVKLQALQSGKQAFCSSVWRARRLKWKTSSV